MDAYESFSRVSSSWNARGSFAPHFVRPSFPGWPPLVVEKVSKSTSERRAGGTQDAPYGAYGDPVRLAPSRGVRPVSSSFSVRNRRIRMSSGKHSLVEWLESRQLESPKTETRPVSARSPPSADSSRNAAIANSAFRDFGFFCFAAAPPAAFPSASSPYTPGSFAAWSARCATCTCALVGACAMSAPVAYTMGSPDLSIAVPFSSRSPSCTPNGRSKSLSAGTFPPPVTGVQCECVLSSKNRMLSICFTLNHSANTASPRPLFKTSSVSLAISSVENSSSESTRSKAPYSRASKHVSGDPRIST